VVVVELLSSPEAWISLAFLSFMEIVLGIDNIVVITILCGRLPHYQQARARRLGLGFALITRVLLLLTVSFFANQSEALFTFVKPWSVRDLIFLGGGLFLLYKGIAELREVGGEEDGGEAGEGSDASEEGSGGAARWGMIGIVVQIMFMDIVFSLDSVISAVAMANDIPIMVAAVLIAVMVMMWFVGPVGDFIQENPSIKILALSSVVLIGLVLLGESGGAHIEKSMVYTALAFGLSVQMLDLRRQAKVRGRALESHGVELRAGEELPSRDEAASEGA
jgi:predicted tellurium resistance membrane protein TerC